MEKLEPSERIVIVIKDILHNALNIFHDYLREYGMEKIDSEFRCKIEEAFSNLDKIIKYIPLIK